VKSGSRYIDARGWLRSDHAVRVRARRHRLHPFLDQPGPVAIAHRGGAEEAPENTLEAFGAAVALGYRYLETDAHVSRDGVVVAFHDPRLDNSTDRTGAIAALSIAEVAEADAGYVFSPDAGRSYPFRARGVRIPRLEELLLRWPEARVNIDPKADACVEPAVAVIDRLGAWDRVGIGAFSDRRLRRIRALSRGRACTSLQHDRRPPRDRLGGHNQAEGRAGAPDCEADEDLGIARLVRIDGDLDDDEAVQRHWD
jgi:glycerophosphoryl diester phosphodiesterase